MCGIASIVGPLCERNTLERMVSVLGHRGPDGTNIWMGTEEKVALGHTKLSVIDPKGNNQPMFTSGKRMVLVYNGEIYNYLELQNELYSSLSSMRDNWKTSSDTEVLLYIMSRMGIDGLKKLNGMYAFVAWDERYNKLYAVRDRLGIKPLYYYFDGENLITASEIKAILKAGVAPQMDLEGVSQFVELQYCLNDRTMFKGIKKLLPGHYLEYDYYTKSLKCEKYWDIAVDADTEYNEEKYIEEISFLLTDAMQMQLRSDYPVGFHLSGGLDSSTICYLASRLKSTPIKTFTGGFKVDNYDESHHAKTMADSIGALNFTTFPSSEDLRESFKKIIYMLDEPVAGAAIFPQYFLSKLISESGVRVALGGQGGDELFCGYARYLIAVLEDSLGSKIYSSSGGESRSGMLIDDVLSNLCQLQGYEPLMQKYFSDNIFGDFPERYYHLMIRTSGLDEIISPDVYRCNGMVKSVFVEEFNRCQSDNIIDQMCIFDMRNHLQSLLHLEDRASMAWSVESRVPLLDHRIVETVMRIPAEERLRGGNLKHIFKRVVHNYLPSSILNRTDKKGFPVPIVEWFGGDLRDWVRDILLSQKARERGIFDASALESRLDNHYAFDRTIWGLLSMEFWFQNYFDG
jgi:asparagine synthase (glutamine-hydrolysing)